jgi:hypothetical protein
MYYMCLLVLLVMDNERCCKCKRNVLSKALYCDQGQHWVHYRCLKLNSEEITAIEWEFQLFQFIFKFFIQIFDINTFSIQNNFFYHFMYMWKVFINKGSVPFPFTRNLHFVLYRVSVYWCLSLENCSDNLDQNTTSQTHANLVQINREKQFSLNIEKALEKKILATKREVQFEYHRVQAGYESSIVIIPSEFTFIFASELLSHDVKEIYCLFFLKNRTNNYWARSIH